MNVFLLCLLSFVIGGVFGIFVMAMFLAIRDEDN